MKRRILSALLALAMVLTMAPAALAAEPTADGPFQVGEASYASLKEAVENIGSEKTITLSGAFEGDSSNIAGIPAGVTLVIEENASLSIDLVGGFTFLGSAGAVRIMAGGSFAFNGTTYVGADSQSKINLSEGSVTVDEFDDSVLKFKITLDSGSVAEIPEGTELKMVIVRSGMDLTIEEGATLIVNGYLNPTGGQSSTNPSNVNIQGSLEIKETGELRMAFGARVTVEDTGKLVLNEKGILDSNGEKPYNNTSNKRFTYEEGCTLVVPEGCTWNPADYTASTLKSYKDSDGNTVYVNTDIEPTEADAAVNGYPYATLDAALAAAGSGDTVTLLKDAVSINAGTTFASGATLDVASGKTLNIPMLFAEDAEKLAGDIVIHSGATVQYASYTNIVGPSGAQLTMGSDAQATLNLAAATLSLDAGTVSIAGDDQGRMFTRIPLTDGYLVLDVAIAENATAEIPAGKTLKVVAGSEMTINGTLTAAGDTNTDPAEHGTLTLSENGTLTVNGALTLPMMTADQLGGTIDGTGLRGDIVINSGASVTYATEEILGTSDSLLTLGSGGSATLNVGAANDADPHVALTLTGGDATVVQDLNALLLTGTSPGEHVPFRIETESGTSLTVPSGVELILPKDSALEAYGDVTIDGALEVHGNTLLGGTFQVNGSVEFTAGVNDHSSVTLTVGENGTVTGEGTLTGVTVEQTFTITVNAPNGTYTPDPAEVQWGQDATITVTPNEGYKIVSATLDGGSITGADGADGAVTYTIEDVKADHTLAVTFQQTGTVDPEPPVETTADVTVQIGGSGTVTANSYTVSVSGTVIPVPVNQEVVYTLTPAEGWGAYSVSMDGTVLKTFDAADSTEETFSYSVSGDATLLFTFMELSEEPDDPTPSRPGGGGGGVVSGYRVTVSGAEHGAVQVNPRNAKEGDTVTITVTPDEGYVLDSLTVTASDGTAVRVQSIGNDQYTFTMPDGRVTVEAEFAEYVAPLPFDDVAANDWFAEAVRFVYENGLMNGTGSGRFSPDATTTRGMIVTILYRLIGEPAAGAGSFSDVTSGAYYADAIAWAAANDIVNGYTDGTFRPDAPITREQMAAILYRYSRYCGYTMAEAGSLSGYADASQVSGYAAEAMGWANGAGLITGVTTTALNPAGSATRAQVATILMRYIQTVAE